MGILFVAGVHGVGKTTICSRVGKELFIPHFTASEIIKNESLENALVDSNLQKNTNANQEILIHGVHRKLVLIGQKLILDGHFTLLNDINEIVEISIEFFNRLSLDAIVVFHDLPHLISLRLRERDGVYVDEAHIKHHQENELHHANLIATSLQIPITHLEAFDSHGFTEILLTTWPSLRPLSS
ncbi:MAG: AAA family ATPase [Verrucomicrobia bacterium]|nr:AAA family ATPase [Verrucomicrobiota bacterium]